MVDCWSKIYNPDPNLESGFAMALFVDGLRDLFAEFECGGLVIGHPHRPKEKANRATITATSKKEAGFRSMWGIVADPPAPDGPRNARISYRKLSEGEPFATVQAIVDFGGAHVSFSTPSADTGLVNRDGTDSAGAFLIDGGNVLFVLTEPERCPEVLRHRPEVTNAGSLRGIAIVRPTALPQSRQRARRPIRASLEEYAVRPLTSATKGYYSVRCISLAVEAELINDNRVFLD